MAWIARLRGLFGRDKLAKEQDEELEFHLSMREKWNVEQGLAGEEARRDARIRLGNKTTWRERMSEIDLMLFPRTVLQDLRYGARLLVRNIGFTIAAVLALAIGIGVNTAAFTAYKAFFKRPLDARDSGSMVNLAISLQSGDTQGWLSIPDFVAYRDGVHAFSGVIATSDAQNLTLTSAGGIVSQRPSAEGTLAGRLGLVTGNTTAETASTYLVSENYFSVLRVGALLGRVFEAEDVAKPAASTTALISENYWQRRFGGDSAVLGKTVRLNGIAFTIVGITPHNFVGTSVEAPDFWLPLSAEPLIHPRDNWLNDRENLCCRLYARLFPGITLDQARAEMTALAGHLRSLHATASDLAKPVNALVWPGSPFPRPLNQFHWLRYVLLLLLIAVGMVLMIACANVASLQLARAASRQSELAMRLSLGASRMRIIRQLLTESALLGGVAGAVALLFSWAMLQIAVYLVAQAFPADYGTFIFHVTPDPGIFAFVSALSVVAGIIFGLAPALESSRTALATANKSNATTSPGRSRRMRGVLTTAQVAISMVLMIAGSMLIHASIRALTMDTGYDSKHAVQLMIRFPEGLDYSAERKLAVVREMRSRMAAMPGVAAVTTAFAPDNSNFRSASVALNGEPPTPRNTQAVLFYTYVQADYFQTLGIPLLFGRGFQVQAGSPEPAAILSESAAHMLWPGQNPIGRSIRLGTFGLHKSDDEIYPDGPVYQVIGIARDTRGVLMDGTDSEKIFLPMPQDRIQNYPIVVRTRRRSGTISERVGAGHRLG